MMNIDTFKATVNTEMLKDMIAEIEVVFDRCFLNSFYLEPSADGITCEFIANFKKGSQYLYLVPIETLVMVFTAESFGKAFNQFIRPLGGERL